jgi:hypothetical protein
MPRTNYKLFKKYRPTKDNQDAKIVVQFFDYI